MQLKFYLIAHVCKTAACCVLSLITVTTWYLRRLRKPCERKSETYTCACVRACELRSRVYKQNTISPENAQPILTAVSLSLTLSFFRLDNLQQETATTENVIKPVKCIKQRKSSSSSTSGCSLSNRYFFSVISVKQQRSDCARARSRPPHFGGRKT